MTTKAIDSNTALQIVRNYDASPEKVFEALVEPSILAKWFAPSAEYSVHVDRFDNEVGGSYRIEMRNDEGEVHTVIGTFKEIDRPNRLVYTWKWEGGEMPDTLVTWEMQKSGSGTELVLTHEQFPNKEARDNHLKGWTPMMPRLAEVLEA